MAVRRDPLHPEAAQNEGQRRLRLLLRKESYAGIARWINVDATTVRLWAHNNVRPQLVHRARMETAPQIRIPEWTWDEPPITDIYAGPDPETTKR